METSVKAAKVLVPPEPDEASPPLDSESPDREAAATACGSSSDFFDPMKEFSRRLEDIISTHGSAAAVLDKQSLVEAEEEKTKEEAKDDSTVSMEKEVSLIMQSLSSSSSPEDKLEKVVRKSAELAASSRCDEKKLGFLQQRISVLLEERQQLQAERRSSITARCKLETLCRELQEHYSVLREETLQRCREDEDKRTELTSQFEKMLTEIQAQIEQHSARNDKLCRENTTLTDKLESLMNQCEQREESLEKINRHRDLQNQLTEAKLQQANALLAEAEAKHKREKEYLLREAIDKTKKCFAMKEQELAMKKKLLVQAAEWKLQAQTLREQATVMQAQLTLYGQKFDEFQETLAKSNEIYVRFKAEMEKMSDKMKKLEKESNLWKTRFENCNKALTDMIEERAEKSKEYDVFVLKIQKLEKLCRTLQDERKVLYDKIKEVRHANSNLPSKLFGSSKPNDDSEGADKSALLTPGEIEELQEEDLVLTEDMARLREQQAKLQEFAHSLLASNDDEQEEDNNDINIEEEEEDLVSSAFIQFKTKKVVDSKSEVAETDLPQPDKTDEIQKPVESKTPETIPTDPKPETLKVHFKDEVQEVQQVKPDEEIQDQQQPAEQEPAPVAENATIDPQPESVNSHDKDKEVQQVKPDEEIQDQQQPAEQEPAPVAENATIDPQPESVNSHDKDKEVQQVKPDVEQEPAPEVEEVGPPTDAQPEATEVKIPEDSGEVTHTAVPVEEEKVQKQPSESLPATEKAPTTSGSTPPSENTPKTAESSTKQAPKKKKKKGGKNAS